MTHGIRTLWGHERCTLGQRDGTGVDGQDGHEDSEPQFLGAEQRVGVGSPFPRCAVVAVSKDDEDPGGLWIVSSVPASNERHFETYCEAEPADETVMLLKNIMMVADGVLVRGSRRPSGVTGKHPLANPRESAQDRNKYKGVGNNAGGNDRAMRDGVQPYDVDYLIHQPPAKGQSGPQTQGSS